MHESVSMLVRVGGMRLCACVVGLCAYACMLTLSLEYNALWVAVICIRR